MLFIVFVFNDHVSWVVSLDFLEGPGEEICRIQIFSEEVFKVNEAELNSIIISWRLLIQHELENWEGEFFHDENEVQDDVWEALDQVVGNDHFHDHVTPPFRVIEIGLVFGEEKPKKIRNGARIAKVIDKGKEDSHNSDWSDPYKYLLNFKNDWDHEEGVDDEVQPVAHPEDVALGEQVVIGKVKDEVEDVQDQEEEESWEANEYGIEQPTAAQGKLPDPSSLVGNFIDNEVLGNICILYHNFFGILNVIF